MTESPGSSIVPRKGPHARNVKGKGLIRSLNRGFARTKKTHPAEAAAGHLPEPSICEGCGGVFSRRVWRRDRKITGALLQQARWTHCPACKQVGQGAGFGRVIMRGAYALAHEAAIRKRLANVASRAGRTQPQRRISSVDRHHDMIEVTTTSQKLAHRIVHELRKVFRGRASYSWSDDGTLFATWERER
jgi:hypothetical protein